MSGYRCASTQAILELFEYNAAIQTPARLMIDAEFTMIPGERHMECAYYFGRIGAWHLAGFVLVNLIQRAVD